MTSSGDHITPNHGQSPDQDTQDRQIWDPIYQAVKKLRRHVEELEWTALALVQGDEAPEPLPRHKSINDARLLHPKVTEYARTLDELMKALPHH